MARWRLTVAHYVFTDPPTEWEYKETDRNTGKQNRMVSKVPRLLDPKDPSDCNRDGECIVTDGNNSHRGDVRILGNPTPDMEPLDKEAEAITQRFIDNGTWNRQQDGEVFGEGLLNKFLAEIAKVQSGQPVPTSVSANAVDPKAFAELQTQVKELLETNAKLQAQVLSKMPVTAKPAPQPARV